MAKIILDIFLILCFIAVAGLQAYVIFRIKDLKSNYVAFMQSQQDFIKAIEKAKQSLMIVNSQAVDVLPDLKKYIEESDSLMQDFSFVLARANKKIDVLQELSNIDKQQEYNKDEIIRSNQASAGESMAKNQSAYNSSQANKVPLSHYEMSRRQEQSNIAQPEQNEYSNTGQSTDPLLARLEQMEKQEQENKNENVEDLDFLKADIAKQNHQQELIEKALKEIL